MVNSNNKQSGGLLSNAFGVAKKFSNTGLELLNHVAPDSVAKVTQALNANDVIEGAAQSKSPFEAKTYQDPQQLLREQLPSLSRQLLGRHFNTVNNAAHFIAPQLSDKVSDYFFERLNQFSNDMSSVDHVLDEAGARDLEELTQDVDRSKRLAQALREQNKWFASVQGALSGATGVIGSAIDIPASLIMALRMIYQVGRAYGFDLSKEQDQEAVQYIFKQIDLGLIAEKQALLLAVKTLASTLQTHDVKQLQSLVGSSNDLESIKKFFVTADGQFKWQWLNGLPKTSVLSQLSKLSPVAGASIGAVYSWRLVEDVHAKAQQVFSHARVYLLQHKELNLTPIAAYEKAIALLEQSSLKLLDQPERQSLGVDELQLNKDIPLPEHAEITQVKVIAKTEEQKEIQQKPQPQVIVVPNRIEKTDTEKNTTAALAQEELQVDVVPEIQQGIEALAEDHIQAKGEVLEAPSKKQLVEKKAVETSMESQDDDGVATDKAALAKTTNTAEIELKPRVKKTPKKDTKTATETQDPSES